jgi:antitoxin (DNA-binding transcriptional repressor) of toxin-antitoxin stability system
VLEAKMLEYLRRVEEKGEELIVTVSHELVIRIVPIRSLLFFCFLPDPRDVRELLVE